MKQMNTLPGSPVLVPVIKEEPEDAIEVNQADEMVDSNSIPLHVNGTHSRDEATTSFPRLSEQRNPRTQNPIISSANINSGPSSSRPRVGFLAPNYQVQVGTKRASFVLRTAGNLDAFPRGSKHRLLTLLPAATSAVASAPAATPKPRMKLISTITDVSNREFNELERKAAEFDVWRDAVVTKRQEINGLIQQKSELERKTELLTYENERLNERIEILMKNETILSRQNDELSYSAREMQENFVTEKSNLQKEIQDLSTKLQDANNFIEKLLCGMSKQVKKGKKEYAKLNPPVEKSSTGDNEDRSDDEMAIDENSISEGSENEATCYENSLNDSNIENETFSRRTSTRLLKKKRKPFSCSTCSAKFISNHDVKEHEKTVHQEPKQRKKIGDVCCRFCNERFQLKLLAQHQKVVHGRSRGRGGLARVQNTSQTAQWIKEDVVAGENGEEAQTSVDEDQSFMST